MYEIWLACQIIGGLLMLAGAYLIGSWWVMVGVLFIVWGNNIQHAVPKGKPTRPDKSDNSWIGD